MAKIGEGHAEAMLRQGLREVRGALYPESNVAQPGEYGLYGTLTPGEVAEGRRETTLDAEQEVNRDESILEQNLQQSAERSSMERDQPEPEIER